MQVAKLSADLYANTSRFESGMKKASGILGNFANSVDKAMGKTGGSFNKVNAGILSTRGALSSLASEFGNLAAVAAGAFSVSSIIKYSDSYTNLSARLKIAVGDSQDYLKVQERIFEIAKKNASPVADVADAYSKLSLSLNENQKSQFDLVQISDLLGKTLLVSGTNAAGAATFYQQFGQAASSDFKAIGQEIQTFQDQNAFFAKILKDNLDTGGRSLKEFAADGELSFDLIAKALLKAQGEIEATANQIPTTVGRALVKLDNEFLKFIGQSDLANQGVSSLAAGINILANNLPVLGQVIGVVAVGAFGILAGAVTRVGLAMITATTQNIAYQATLARLAGVSGVAATASLGLAGALRVVGVSVAALGGPLGIALIGTYLLMTSSTGALSDQQERLNKVTAGYGESVQEFVNADNDRRNEIITNTQDIVRARQEELKSIAILYNAYAKSSGVSRFFQNLGSKVGIGEGGLDIAKQGAAIENEIAEYEKILKEFDRVKNPITIKQPTSGGGEEKKTGKNTYKDIVSDLDKELELLKNQVDLYGQKESALKAAERQILINQKLEKSGIELSKTQREELNAYLKEIENQTILLEKQDEVSERLAEKERNRQQALDQLGATFESAFEDAIVNGEKFGDVLNSLLNDIQKILIRSTITEPLGSFFTDIGKSLGDSVFGTPSFATGSANIPYDMMARVHKGEAIVPAQQAKNMGGGDMVVNIVNNSSAKVSQQGGEGGMPLTVMIDEAVARQIGTSGSKTNQALGAYNSRSLVRR